ncbi:MAG: cobyrinate a,c-diamide synthase, partial [Synergistaceae bacterium]
MTKKTAHIPRILIAATQSGSGKTTITSGILELLRRRGITPQAYKVGPDYIDPTYLAAASGRAVHNLDTWLLPEEKTVSLFAKGAADADIAIVEGVMGLYDGGQGGVSSSASIAKLLKLPVILVIDVKSMGESAAAIALGFLGYDKDVMLKGVILNKVGSENHKKMICDAMEKIGIPVFGTIFRNDTAQIKERHLGLLPEQENENKNHIKDIADTIEQNIDLDAIIKAAQEAPELTAEEESRNS